MPRTVKLGNQILFYPDPDSTDWVAHCLDLDLVGMGRTMHAAFAELVSSLEVYVREWVALGEEAAPPSPAPKRFWDAARKAEKLPDVRLGEIKDWLDEHLPPKRKPGLSLPERCSAAVIMERDLVPAL